MKSTNWKDIAEIVGISAIVASLIFVGIEVRQSQTIAVAETNTAAMGNWAERFDSINEHADVWFRGAAGEELQSADTVVFNNLVRAFSTGYFMDWYRLKQLGEEQSAVLLRSDFTTVLHQNPGVRAAWKSQTETMVIYRKKMGIDMPTDPLWNGQVNDDLSMLDGHD